MTDYPTLEIKSPTIARIAVCLDPNIGRLDYEDDLRSNFLVCDFPSPGAYLILTPEQLGENFDHIENGEQITLKRLVKN
jgi:hypothetical protein